MDAAWGDDVWRKELYKTQPTLFGYEEFKVSNDEVAKAFRMRLKEVAGFEFVPEPMPMRNKTHNIIYYLYFASFNETGGRIVNEIFNKYRKRGFR